ncbi:MAG: phytoene desaturase family protein [Chitinophagaceae bacterium]
MNKVSVIGSGFSGLAAAAFAAAAGNDVHIFEKNAQIGGRARAFVHNGFVFDMGPSWYWMPDVFEQFFQSFGKHTSDYYQLKKLDPGFQIIFGKDDVLEVPADVTQLYSVFEQIEKGSALKLRRFLDEAAFKYEVGMKKLVYKPAFSWLEYATWDVLKGVSRTHMFTSVQSYVRSFFKDPRLIALLEFPVLFLGAMPDSIPALYTLMNYSALVQGTYYPVGGMLKVIDGMRQLCEELGVNIHLETEVTGIHVQNGKASGIHTSRGLFDTDAVVGAADYHHVEQRLLPEHLRNYSEKYWSGKTFAPSCLIFYVGVKRKIKGLFHHNLYFDTDFALHAREIYREKRWPKDPLFYVCCPSKTDASVAPEEMENLFILVPVATGLEDSETVRDEYFDRLIERMERYCGDSFKDDIIYKRSYSVNDFVKDYNAYGGNAYGLANTLSQTAVLKPSLRNKRVQNLFYAGQLTVPGPGVPPSLISGRLAAHQVNQYLLKQS